MTEQALSVLLVSSSGLLLEYKGASLLIDSPSRAFMGFPAMGPGLQEQLFAGQPPFDRLSGLVFTHSHPDHCDRQLVGQYLKEYPGCGLFVPEADTPDRGSLTFGPFTVEYARTEHLPLPKVPAASQTDSIPHCCMLVRAGGKSVYVSGDAVAKSETHRLLLDGQHPDLAFWNPMYFSAPEMRQLMASGIAIRNYVYHLPTDPADQSGMGRKVRRCLERYAGELTGIERAYMDKTKGIAV